MSHYKEMEPLITKTKPYIFLVELSPDPARRRSVKQFLTRFLQKLHAAVAGRNGIPLFVGIYPFGTGCSEGPVFPESCECFDASSLEGSHCTTPAPMLSLLNRHLSLSGKMNFPAGAYLPTLLFLGDWKAEEADRQAVTNLEYNRWFRFSSKWLFSYGEVSDPEFAYHFVSPGKKPLALPPDGSIPGDNSIDLFRIFEAAGPSLVDSGSLMGSLLPTDSALTGLLRELVQTDPLVPEPSPTGDGDVPGEDFLMGEATDQTMGLIDIPMMGDIPDYELPPDNVDWDPPDIPDWDD